MKVLIICTEKLPVPPIKGGAIQTYIAGALPDLKKNHQITVLGRSDDSLPDDEIQDDIRYCRIEGGQLDIYRDNVVEFLKASAEQYDLIHIFNRPRLVNAVRALAPDSKIILSMHNDMFKPEKLDPEEGTIVVKNVDKIITISNYIGRTIAHFFPEAESKLQTIYSGVDLDRFVPSYSSEAQELRTRIRNEHNLTSKKVILYAGRLSPNKGIDVLIRAIPDLAENHEDIALVVMGSKWFSDNSVTDYIAYVRALAERLPIPVIQTGFVSPDKIQEWFVASDIFVCTSQWQEPLARVHYEAMAAALPIVTTDRGGNTEVIEPYQNGIVVENPEDSGEFVEHLSYLLNNPDKGKEMGRYGRSLAEKHYTWDRVVSNISTVWDEVKNMPFGEYEMIDYNLPSKEPDKTITAKKDLENTETEKVYRPFPKINVDANFEVEEHSSETPDSSSSTSERNTTNEVTPDQKNEQVNSQAGRKAFPSNFAKKKQNTRQSNSLLDRVVKEINSSPMINANKKKATQRPHHESRGSRVNRNKSCTCSTMTGSHTNNYQTDIERFKERFNPISKRREAERIRIKRKRKSL
ncbi:MULTISPECIES: glycosyltransferase family 4 protein [Thalassobacillus]|uniref:glycosyltransferase family 4 protein n=1 Tax=Thalassobacillus TaxID=331971 RepID=UPI000A1C8248|nr:glycosyltransferase family 4 protein [Thalassobacillus devorans]